MKQRTDFYPRPPRGGRPFRYGRIFWAIQFLSTPSARRATSSAEPGRWHTEFLSTPSARRATLASLTIAQAILDFYPRPPRGGRPYLFPRHFLYQCISIHALREEGDCSSKRKPSRSSNFYPRPPRGGRPDIYALIQSRLDISIHALREEGDEKQRQLYQRQADFYPRPPRGGRLYDAFN